MSKTIVNEEYQRSKEADANKTDIKVAEFLHLIFLVTHIGQVQICSFAGQILNHGNMCLFGSQVDGTLATGIFGIDIDLEREIGALDDDEKGLYDKRFVSLLLMR